MTQEEKAKAYDEAIEKLRNLHDNYDNTVSTLIDIKEELEHIFPELAESEDERIRKYLIYCVNRTIPESDDFNEISKEQILAWLEKQYASIDVDSIINKVGIKPAYKDGNAWCILYGDNIQDGVCGFGYTKEEALIEFLKDLLEKQGEQKEYIFKPIPRLLDMIEPSDRAKAYCQKLIDTLAKEGYNTDAKNVEEVLKGWNGEEVPMAVMDEQKPTEWSDEDERIRKTLIENFKFFGGDYLETLKWGKDDDLLVTDIIAWLEKQGQKPAWSEEDEEMYQNIHECLKNGWRKLSTDLLKYESWFESIKQRIR